MNIRDVDRRIIDISREMDFYALLTPLNQEEEEKRFFRAFAEGKRYDPVYEYRQRKLDGHRAELRGLSDSLSPDGDIEAIIARKIGFMLGQIELLTSSDASFAGVSRMLYGVPEKRGLDLAHSILSDKGPQEEMFPDETVSYEEMIRVLRGELDAAGISWLVKPSRKIVPKISVSGRDRTIYVNSRLNYTEAEIQRLKVHEIEVHAYRGANGEEQPFLIFREGLAGYDETEEGLAIVAEEKMGCLEVDKRQMRLYAGRYLAAASALKSPFYDTFVYLKGLFPDYLAYRLTERVKRGMRDTSFGGGFTQGLHYLAGLLKLKDYIAKGGDLSILYVGKVGLGDVERVKRLLDKGILRPPRHLPAFLS